MQPEAPNGVACVEVIADLFNFMEYAKARGRHDGRFTQIRLWIQFVLGKAVCLILGILDVCGKLTYFFSFRQILIITILDPFEVYSLELFFNHFC